MENFHTASAPASLLSCVHIFYNKHIFSQAFVLLLCYSMIQAQGIYSISYREAEKKVYFLRWPSTENLSHGVGTQKKTWYVFYRKTIFYPSKTPSESFKQKSLSSSPESAFKVHRLVKELPSNRLWKNILPLIGYFPLK